MAIVNESLRLVDISMEEPKQSYPILDVKLRNIGKEVVFLKRAIFHIMKIGQLRNPQGVSYALVPVSWNYDVQFDTAHEGAFITHGISQSINPNAVDRFTFTISQKRGDPVLPTLFYFTLTLVYNEDDKKIVSQPIILPIPNDIQAGGAFVYGFNANISKENLRILGEFSKLEGLSSERFKVLIEVNLKRIRMDTPEIQSSMQSIHQTEESTISKEGDAYYTDTTLPLQSTLAQALYPLYPLYAKLISERNTDITSHTAPFLRRYRIYNVTNLSVALTFFWVAYFSPDTPVYLLRAKPASFSALAHAGEIVLDTPTQAADYVSTFLAMTESKGSLFYVINSVSDILFYPTMDKEEEEKKRRFLAQYCTQVTPVQAIPDSRGYTVMLYAMRQQALEHHTLLLEQRGIILNHRVKTLEDFLPTRYSW